MSSSSSTSSRAFLAPNPCPTPPRNPLRTPTPTLQPLSYLELLHFHLQQSLLFEAQALGLTQCDVEGTGYALQLAAVWRRGGARRTGKTLQHAQGACCICESRARHAWLGRTVQLHHAGGWAGELKWHQEITAPQPVLVPTKHGGQRVTMQMMIMLQLCSHVRQCQARSQIALPCEGCSQPAIEFNAPAAAPCEMLCCSPQDTRAQPYAVMPTTKSRAPLAQLRLLAPLSTRCLVLRPTCYHHSQH